LLVGATRDGTKNETKFSLWNTSHTSILIGLDRAGGKRLKKNQGAHCGQPARTRVAYI